MSTFPPSGGASPSTQIGLNPYVQYVSPTGNDSYNGTSWQSAKRTIGAAIDTCFAKSPSGGEIHFADMTPGNIWLRGDGLVADGWHPAFPLRFIGHSWAHTQFGDPAARLDSGSTTDRLHPGVWVTASISAPIVFENMVPAKDGNTINQAFRMGWDYKRYNDGHGTIAFTNVTNWDRTATPSVDSSGVTGGVVSNVTVTLPTGRSMYKAQRASNIVYIGMSDPSPLDYDVHKIGQWVKITDTSGSLNSGNFQITGLASVAGLTGFQYADTGSDTALLTDAGTYQTTEINVNDRIEVVSTNSEVPSCAYKVISCTSPTVFAVRDYTGYSPRTPVISVNNIGQMVVQKRNWGIGLCTIDNCQDLISAETGDQFVNGPAVDFGSTSDGRLYIQNGAHGGMVSTTIDCRDPDRRCWLLLDGGSISAPSAIVRNERPGGGGIRVWGSGAATWGITTTDVLCDIAVGAGDVPALDVLDGNSSGYVIAKNTVVFDQTSNTAPNVRVDPGMYQGFVRIDDCGAVDGPGYVQGRLPAAWSEETKSPQNRIQVGPWAGDKISGRTPDGYRNLGGLASARYANLALSPGSWTLDGGGTTTTGIADPFGGTGAVRINGPSNAIIYQATLDLVNGEHWILASWFKQTGGLTGGPGGYLQQFERGVPRLPIYFLGDGEWQFYVESVKVTTTEHAQQTASIGAGNSTNHDLIVYDPVVIRVPNGDMTDNEFYEFAQTIRAQPNYLAAGMTGTGAGKKFIGHGGFGTNSANAKTVGVGSGQLTLTGTGTVYLPMYDTDGTTIIGWVAQLQATVNP